MGEPTAAAFAMLERTGFDTQAFFASLSPDQRSVLGFPAVDSEYWTPETLEVARMHFGEAFDLEPYSGRVRST